MPVYFFHSVLGGVDLGSTGTELISREAAQHAAIMYARHIMKDEPSHVSSDGGLKVE